MKVNSVQRDEIRLCLLLSFSELAMTFLVTKFAPVMVQPSEPTPLGMLPLSVLDQWAQLRVLMEMLQVFRHGHEPVKAIQKALSKALVPYYPIAGRIAAVPGTRDIQVECTGEGVLFVESAADCSLEDVEFLDVSKPLMILKEQLLPYAPQDERSQIFMMQVTQFKCGGFAVGIKFSHAIFDGVALSHFLRAIGEIATARGGEPMQLPTKPIWCREAIPKPSLRSPRPCYQHLVPFEPHVTDISRAEVNKMKDYYRNETGRNSSTFDIVTAKVWQSRTRAIGTKADTDATLSFTMCFRQVLAKEVPQLLEGDYYGNCIYYMTVRVPSERITNTSLVEVTNLVKDCKESLPTKCPKWLKGDSREDPQQWYDGYEDTRVSDWRTLGFNDVDYGWGKPISVAPLNVFSYCILVNSPAPMKGVRVMTQFIYKEHLEAYKNELKNLV